MTNKQKALIAGAALLLAFALGRWAAPTKVVTEVKTVEVEKKTETTNTEVDRDKHKETKTVEETKPDGTKTTTTTTVEDTKTGKTTGTVTQDDTSKSTDKTKEVTYPSSKVTISALAGVPISLSGFAPVWGVSASKPILGPITVGVFGFTSGLAGVSLGLTF